MAVFFQQQRAGNGFARFFLQTCLHCRNGDQFGFNYPLRGGCLREGFRQIRCEAVETRMRVVHVGFGQPDIGQPLSQRGGTRVKPGGFFQGNQILNQRKATSATGAPCCRRTAAVPAVGG